MAEDLELRLTLDDEASRGLDQVQGKAEDLTDKPYDIDLRVKGDKATEADLKRIAHEAQETADRIEDLGQETVTFRVNDADLKQALNAIGDVQAKLARLDAETVDITIKSDDLGTVRQRLQGVKGDTDKLSDSARSSRSALANMVGNSAQDLGQVGGVAGSAGVAVGQMAEYFADASLAGEGFGAVAASFASVALPIAALSIAVPILSNAWSDLTNHQDMATQSAKSLKAAQDALAAGKYDEGVRALVTSNKDLFDAATKAGVPIEELVKFITGAQSSFTGAGKSLQTTKGFITDLRPALDSAADGWKLNTQTAEENRKRIEEVAKALGLTTDAEGKVTTATSSAAAQQERQAEALVLGLDRANRAATAWNALASAQQDVQAAALVAGLEAQRRAIDDEAKSLGQLQAQLATLNTTFGQTTLAITGAGNAWQFVTDLDTKARDSFMAAEDGLDKLTGGFADNGAALDIHTKKGRDNIKNAEALRKAYGGAFQQTLQDTNGDFDAATIRILGMTQEFDKQAKAAGLSQKQIAEYHHELGLTPEQITTTIKLTKDDEARQKLALMQGAIAGLDKDVQVEVATLISQGKFQEAVALLGSLQVDPKTGQVRQAPVEPNVDDTAAALAQGDIAAVASNNGAGYQATVDVDADTSAARLAIRGLVNEIDIAQAKLAAISAGVFMAGGRVPATGAYRVGEAGPETVILPGGAEVVTAGRTMTAASHGGGGTTNINITLNVPVSANLAEVGKSVVSAISAFERRSGKGWRAA